MNTLRQRWPTRTGHMPIIFISVKGIDGKEPSNYRSYFGGNSVGAGAGIEDKYYLHMPLQKNSRIWNWENPEVTSDNSIK